MLSNEDYQHIFHEIKNIVTLINSSLQMIAKQHPEIESYDYWNDAVSDVRTLKDIVVELSTVKIGENITKIPTNVPHFLDEIMHATRATLEEHIVCTFHTEEDLPDIGMDSFRMKQAMINLIKNALEAMNGAGTLTIHTFQRDHSLYFEFTDNGCGIDPAVLTQIYTPFYTSKPNGSGLGLVITKTIVESHGGTISCRSVLGKGTTFTISLPY